MLYQKWGGCAKRHRYRSSRLLGYELVPHSCPDVNSFGMRDKEYTLTKSKDTYRILLLGDSICEIGHWSDYLEDMLNTQGKYEILNSGTSAWGLCHYYLYLKNKGLQFQPDLVLMGLCLNDVNSTDTPIMYRDKKHNKTLFYTIKCGPDGSRDITLNINPFLYRYSFLYRLIALHYVIGNKTKVPGDAHTLLEMKSIVTGNICAVVFPYLKPLRQYNEQERLQYDNTIQYLKQSKIDYMDLTPSFNNYGESIVKFRWFPTDAIHFNDEANRIKAKIIYPWLINEIHKMRDHEPNTNTMSFADRTK